MHTPRSGRRSTGRTIFPSRCQPFPMAERVREERPHVAVAQVLQGKHCVLGSHPTHLYTGVGCLATQGMCLTCQTEASNCAVSAYDVQMPSKESDIWQSSTCSMDVRMRLPEHIAHKICSNQAI